MENGKSDITKLGNAIVSSETHKTIVLLTPDTDSLTTALIALEKSSK